MAQNTCKNNTEGEMSCKKHFADCFLGECHVISKKEEKTCIKSHVIFTFLGNNMTFLGVKIMLISKKL